MANEKDLATQLIKKHKGYAYGIYENDLGREMAEMFLHSPGVVYYVFVVLQEQRYDTVTIIRIARIFLDATPQATLNRMVWLVRGQVAIRMVKMILKCDADDNKTAARCMKLETALNQIPQRRSKNQTTSATTNGDNSAQPIKLSSVVMDWYEKYNQTPDVMWNKINGVWNQNGPRVKFNSDICWDLPSSGPGFVSYNIDDLKDKRNDKDGYDQIGTKETVEAMIRIAREWNVHPLNINPKRKLEYGDISRPGGINTPDHGTHMTGKAFDMRLIRKGASDGIGFNYSQDKIYSFKLTKAFILLVVKLYPGTEFYFNDPAIEKDDPDTSKLVGKRGGHNDHLHVMFPGGKE